MFFLDAPGGTGKTFVANALLSFVRANGHVAMPVAASGIAALLLDGGRTVHSRMNLLQGSAAVLTLLPNLFAKQS